MSFYHIKQPLLERIHSTFLAIHLPFVNEETKSRVSCCSISYNCSADILLLRKGLVVTTNVRIACCMATPGIEAIVATTRSRGFAYTYPTIKILVFYTITDNNCKVLFAVVKT